jgi:hypothetical protein
MKTENQPSVMNKRICMDLAQKLYDSYSELTEIMEHQKEGPKDLIKRHRLSFRIQNVLAHSLYKLESKRTETCISLARDLVEAYGKLYEQLNNDEISCRDATSIHTSLYNKQKALSILLNRQVNSNQEVNQK